MRQPCGSAQMSPWQCPPPLRCCPPWTSSLWAPRLKSPLSAPTPEPATSPPLVTEVPEEPSQRATTVSTPTAATTATTAGPPTRPQRATAATAAPSIPAAPRPRPPPLSPKDHRARKLLPPATDHSGHSPGHHPSGALTSHHGGCLGHRGPNVPGWSAQLPPGQGPFLGRLPPRSLISLRRAPCPWGPHRPGLTRWLR